MRTCTSKCRSYGHAEFVLDWSGDDTLDSGLNLLVNWLEMAVAAGERFCPEETAQYGWSILKVVRRSDETLALFEPDFASMPITFVDSVSNTLLHTMLQKFVADSVGLTAKLQIPSILQSCLVCSRLGNRKGLLLDRATPSDERDSGWFIGCTEPGHDHNSAKELQRKSLYETASFLDSRVIPFLGLPAGVKLYLQESKLILWMDGNELTLKPGSYLARKYPGVL